MFGSVINTAKTRYLPGLLEAMESMRTDGRGNHILTGGGMALSGRRKMGPLGEKARNFLMQGQAGGLRARAMGTASRMMNFRGRGLARAMDMPQGQYTQSEAFFRGTRTAGGMRNPQVGGGGPDNPMGYIFADRGDAVSARAKLNIDPANTRNGVKYRMQGYDPRTGMALTSGRRGGVAGQFVADRVAMQTIRNRNRRLMSYGALAGGVGVAGAATSPQRSYTGPSGRMRSAGITQIPTAKGLGRNA